MRVTVDTSVPLASDPSSGHNRWHPGIPPVARVAPGEELTLETRDGLDGVLGPGSVHADVLRIDLTRPHALTGPIHVEGAQPGDVLSVELLAFESSDWGVSCIVPGFGLLSDLFTDPYVVVWEIDGRCARSTGMPGVAIPEAMFPGVIGVAPSSGLMEEMRRREHDLRRRGGAVPDDAPEGAVPPEAADGLRTIPPRETGGNLDVRQLVTGSRIDFPVHVPGALFSIGDLHFAQGDGEVCGVALEICGSATVRFSLETGVERTLRFPSYTTPARPGRESFATIGLPIDDGGRNESMDLTLATRNAVLEMITWLVANRGLTREQAYVLVSVAGDLRISEIVDVPNPAVSCLLPLDIFEG